MLVVVLKNHKKPILFIVFKYLVLFAIKIAISDITKS